MIPAQSPEKHRLFGNWRYPHTSGYLWDNLASGLVLATNTFLNLALLRLATEAANCKGNPTDDEYTCNRSTMGLKPSSWISAIATIGALLGAILTPLVGALSDYTRHRRLVGASSAWTLAIVTLLQSSISESTWFFVALLQIPSITSYVLHQGSSLSYLPGLSRIEGSDKDDEAMRFRVNACTVIVGFGSQIFGILFFVGLSLALSIGIVNLSALVQLTIGMALICIFASIWHPSCFGYRGALVDIPALKVFPQNLYGISEARALLVVSFYEVLGSYRLLRDYYPNVLYFLTGYTLSTAAMSSFASLSIVFLNDHLKLNPTQSVAAVLVTLIVAVPSGALAVRIMARYTARVTFLSVIVCMWASTMVAPLVLIDASAANYIYIFSAFWGFLFGTYYTSNTSFYTQLVPKHSESQFMALYYSAAVLLNFAPPAVFTLINEMTNATIFVFYILAFFFAISYPIIRRVDIEKAQKEIIEHDSEFGIAAAMMSTFSRERSSNLAVAAPGHGGCGRVSTNWQMSGKEVALPNQKCADGPSKIVYDQSCAGHPAV